MTFPQGVNFRNTLAYVTDAADCEFSNSAAYPRTSAQGNTLGWENNGSVNTRNRNSGIDARLAGVNFDPNNTAKFRIDLPATGNYDVRIAAGDATYNNNCAWDLHDTTTLLANLTTGTAGAGAKWKDATNTSYTAANWVSSNTPYAATFSTTILRLVPANASACIAHLYVAAVGGGTIYTLSPGGTIIFSGNSNQLRTRIQVPSGSIVFSGTAPNLRTRLQTISGSIIFSGSAPFSNSATYTMSPGGTITFSGTSVQNHERVQISTGNIAFSGASIMLRTRSLIPTGDITFSGTAPETRIRVQVPTGQIVFLGSAPLINPNAVGGVTTWRTLTGSGN